MHNGNGYVSSPWSMAVDMHAYLSTGGQLPPVEVVIPGLTPEYGEYAVSVSSAPASYARYYGVDVYYSTPSTVFFGSPAFVVGGLIGSAVARSRVRRQAQREAAPQWRPSTMTCLVVTTRRLWCELVEPAGPRWLQFDYDQITGFNLTGACLTLGFLQSEPLQLIGDWIPWHAAVIAHLRYGHAAGSMVPALHAPIR